MGIIAAFDRFDKKISAPIHTLELPKFLEAILFVFAKTFNGEGTIILLALVCGLLPSPDIKYVYLVCVAKYFSILAGSAILIGVLKGLIGRQRPPLNEKVSRISYLRKKEFNASMPSGDSAQSAVFAAFVTFFFPNSIIAPYVWIIPPISAFGRVYFQCHWVFDTVIGISYGTLFVYGNVLLEKAILGHLFVMAH